MSRRFELPAVLLGPDDMHGMEVGTRMVLLSRVDGRIHAIDDWCNHAGCLLSQGRREGRMVVCGCHEIGFDLETGKNLTSPDICEDQPVFRLEELQDGRLVLVVAEGEDI